LSCNTGDIQLISETLNSFAASYIQL